MLEGGGFANLRLCCDPALAADRDGNFWYASLTLGRKSYIVINRVAAGTSDFQPANVAIPRHTGGLQDKPMITIDRRPQSPKYGRLYATWIENSGKTQNVVISECDTRPGGSPDPARCDSPDNWTPGGSLPAVTDASGVYTYPSVAAAPNGDVYVTWWNAGRPPSGNEIEIDSCPAAAADCRAAASWGPDTTVDDLEQKGKNGIPFFCPIRPAPGGRVGPTALCRRRARRHGLRRLQRPAPQRQAPLHGDEARPHVRQLHRRRDRRPVPIRPPTRACG